MSARVIPTDRDCLSRSVSGVETVWVHWWVGAHSSTVAKIRVLYACRNNDTRASNDEFWFLILHTRDNIIYALNAMNPRKRSKQARSVILDRASLAHAGPVPAIPAS